VSRGEKFIGRSLETGAANNRNKANRYRARLNKTGDKKL